MRASRLLVTDLPLQFSLSGLQNMWPSIVYFSSLTSPMYLTQEPLLNCIFTPRLMESYKKGIKGCQGGLCRLRCQTYTFVPPLCYLLSVDVIKSPPGRDIEAFRPG